jgi:DNA polymerase
MAKPDAKGRESEEGGRRTPHGAAGFLPAKRSLRAAREAAAGCRGCNLFRRATQTVFGEGASHARIMLVGETPGDREDIVGRPFVGPAGQLLDRALAAAGIDRSTVYVTNVVKHFKWEPRG